MRRLYLLFLGLLLAVLKDVTSTTTCAQGYKIIQSECIDEDECKFQSPCGQNAVCMNTNGGFFCLCSTGYQTESGAVNFTGANMQNCEDINECLEDKNSSLCGRNADCINTVGSYTCTCRPGFMASNKQEGFKANQNVTCNDQDECEFQNPCGQNAVCMNTNGDFFCRCSTGYQTESGAVNFTGANMQNCVEINESCLDTTICGLNANCINKNGSDFCMCDSGFVASNVQETFNPTQKVTCNVLECNRLQTGSLSGQIPEELDQILIELYSTCTQKGVTGDDMLQILLEGIHAFLLKTPLTDTKTITALFEVVESTLPLVGQLLVNSSLSLLFHHTRVAMLIERRSTAPSGQFNLSTNNVQFNSHWETAVGNLYTGFASVFLFEYQTLKSSFNSSINSYFTGADVSRDQFQLNSKVVTIAVTNPNTTHLERPITLNFTHLQAKVRNIICVFWDSTLKGGAWSPRGCNVVQSSTNHTVCSCSHLSSFAVLMALYEMDHVYELQLITRIGLSLSLICLLICILTFWLVRSIQSTRNTIHLHFCISLFIADFIFLVGINQTANKVGCALVAGLLHFFFLAVFCWMCLEGVQLFRMVVLVFHTTISRGYLVAAGYGVPALIVIISACVNYTGYGTQRYCWLNLERGFIWSFFGPVCVIIVVNAVFFFITVLKLAQKFNSLNPDLSNLRKIKAFTITAVAQLCVLGTMWIFGCFQFDENTVVMSYIFTVLNSLQGVLVFIMHCLLSKQVRDEYIRFLTCLTTPQKRSYSEFSTNQSGKFQMSKSNTGQSRT